MHYGIAGAPLPSRHDNSPKSRRRYASRRIDYRGDKEFFRRPPFAAARALLFSMGYQMAGTKHASQAMKWNIGRRYDWVPFEVTKAGIPHTRWVRAAPGRKMEVSDGSKVRRSLVFRYALARLIGRERAAP